MATSKRFNDRMHAGKLLAARLSAYANRPDVWVLALPRGGVPVGFEVAQQLGAEFDVIEVRKLGLPGHEEYAKGAVGAGRLRVLQAGLIKSNLVSAGAIEQCARRALGDIARREQLYRAGRAPIDLSGHCVILVDDGIATGASLRVAIERVRQSQVARLIVAAVQRLLAIAWRTAPAPHAGVHAAHATRTTHATPTVPSHSAPKPSNH